MSQNKQTNSNNNKILKSLRDRSGISVKVPNVRICPPKSVIKTNNILIHLMIPISMQKIHEEQKNQNVNKAGISALLMVFPFISGSRVAQQVRLVILFDAILS
jgi:hypothetical protein